MRVASATALMHLTTSELNRTNVLRLKGLKTVVKLLQADHTVATRTLAAQICLNLCVDDDTKLALLELGGLVHLVDMCEQVHQLQVGATSQTRGRGGASSTSSIPLRAALSRKVCVSARRGRQQRSLSHGWMLNDAVGGSAMPGGVVDGRPPQTGDRHERRHAAAVSGVVQRGPGVAAGGCGRRGQHVHGHRHHPRGACAHSRSR